MKATITYQNAKIEQITIERVCSPVNESDLMILETRNGFRTIEKAAIQSIIIEP